MNQSACARTNRRYDNALYEIRIACSKRQTEEERKSETETQRKNTEPNDLYNTFIRIANQKKGERIGSEKLNAFDTRQSSDLRQSFYVSTFSLIPFVIFSSSARQTHSTTNCQLPTLLYAVNLLILT